jgi:hypothetical protein
MHLLALESSIAKFNEMVAEETQLKDAIGKENLLNTRNVILFNIF